MLTQIPTRGRILLQPQLRLSSSHLIVSAKEYGSQREEKEAGSSESPLNHGGSLPCH